MSHTTHSAETSTTDAQRLQAFRAGYAPDTRLHLNNSGVAPMCLPSARAISQVADGMSRAGIFALDKSLAAYEQTRVVVAELIGTAPFSEGGAHISMMQTCAVAISHVAFAFPFKKGDKIVTWDQEYGSNAYPWLRAAERAEATLVRVPSDGWHTPTERMLEAIDEQTRVVALSWVQFSTGAITDLAPICRRAHDVGAMVVVDAIQGIGIVPFEMDAWGVDAVCCGTHKWITGPIGHGFLALAPKWLSTLSPLLHGAVTYGFPGEAVVDDKAPRMDRHRYEPGSPLLLGAAGLRAAGRHILAAGISTLHKAAIMNSDMLVEGVRARGCRLLSRTDMSARTPTVTFVPSEDLAAVCARLSAGNVAFAERAGGVRVAPHAFNTRADIERFWAIYDGA